MDSRIELLVSMTDDDYHGTSFNGPSLIETLEDLSLQQICSTDTLEGSSAWGIVLHLIYWKYFLCRELGGDGGLTPFPYEEKDWPAVPKQQDQEKWDEVLTHMETVHNSYLDALRGLSSKDLERIIPGWKCTVLKAVSWMATHDLYHAVQIRNMGV